MCWPIVLLMLTAASFGPDARAEPAKGRTCYSVAETRDKILAHGLFDPFRVLRSAAGSMQADAIGVKLCCWSEDLIYEVSLLRREGQVIHVFVNAKTGAVVDRATNMDRPRR